jgi:hypothetical protein
LRSTGLAGTRLVLGGRQRGAPVNFDVSLMRYFFDIMVFWAVVIVAIRVLVHFPNSVLARVVFSQQGPLPIRGESRSGYFLRWAAFWRGWLVQALCLFGAGWVALRWEASLGDSLVFLVFWGVVVPLLGGVAFLGTVFTLAAAWWIRRFGRERNSRNSAPAPQP